MFPKCEVGENYYCQGMAPFDLNATHDEMNSMIPIILTSEDFESRMNSNYELTKKKFIMEHMEHLDPKNNVK